MRSLKSRLFIALWPGEATRRALVDWQGRCSCAEPAGAALIGADDLHLTLHFLGTVDADRQPPLVAALGAVPLEGFTLSFGRAASWPHGLAIAFPVAMPPALVDLHARLGDVLKDLGHRVERRPYRPHVTLARRCAGMSAADAVVAWPVRSFVLAGSAPERTPEGRRYRLIGRFGLGRQPPSIAKAGEKQSRAPA